MTPSAASPAPEMLAALRARADDRGRLSYADFSDIALFHPTLGYYRRDRVRVGRAAGTDFYTASSVGGTLFGALVADAARSLLGDGADLREYTLVELGAEPGESIFRDVASRFAGLRTVRVGERLDIPPRAVVFANELFDAQPFVRLRFESGAWHELGVAIAPSGELSEVVLDSPSVSARRVIGTLPVPWREGHVVDVSPAADDLLDRIVAGEWRGAVIFADYGKTLREFLDAVPLGSARAYRNHEQSNALLDTPGEQDLTHHVDWSALSARLSAAGFSEIGVERQEAFLMKRAAAELERRFNAAAASRNHSDMGVIRELIHPAHMGGKFQVLSAVRCG